MDDLLLLSIVLSVIALPVFGARDPDPRRGLRRTLLRLLAFHVFYLVSILYLWPRLIA